MGDPRLIRSKHSQLGKYNCEPLSKCLYDLLLDKADMHCIDFIKKCLVFDPEDRMDP